MFLGGCSIPSFSLEAISKLIVNVYKIKFKVDKNQVYHEEMIKAAADYYYIDLNKINFRLSDKRLRNENKKSKLLITDYINELVHSNFEKFDNDFIINEFNKIMILARKLLLSFVEPTLKNFPYINQRYEIDCSKFIL